MTNIKDGTPIRTVVQDLTKGKPYIFIIMPINTHWHFFSLIRQLIRDTVGLECICADDVPGSGQDLLAKIHLLIDRAELVIAEINTDSPNVFYEVGYAVATNKPLLLLIDEKCNVPTDLKGREMIMYGGSKERMEIFERTFREHLQLHLNSHVALLRDMLVADIPKPAFIVASPKYPEKGEKISGQFYDYRTFADNLGIVGLISSFGTIMGEDSGVELISAQYSPPDLLKRPFNLYLIGSPIVNPWVKELLIILQKGKEPNWTFKAEEGRDLPWHRKNEFEMPLYRTKDGKEMKIEGEVAITGPDNSMIMKQDHGIILRAPHPNFPDRLVLIMAGAHAIGTGAACLAATRSPLIQKIKELLPEGTDISNKQQTVWALVRGEISERDGLLDAEGVTIVEAGTYDRMMNT